MLMSGIGLCMAFLYIYCRRENVQLRFKVLLEYFIVCALTGFIGARLLFVVAIIPSIETFTINELVYYLVNGGIVFYGGLFGVILGIVIVSIRKNISPKNMLDFAAPAFPLFHAFARIGCLLAGCCYGLEWNWGVILMDNPDVVRFPVQLFESICDIIIFTGLLLLNTKKKSYKNNLAIYLCSYAVCRFVLEFYRGDQVRGIWYGGFSTSQYISLLILVFYGIRVLHKTTKYLKCYRKRMNIV